LTYKTASRLNYATKCSEQKRFERNRFGTYSFSLHLKTEVSDTALFHSLTLYCSYSPGAKSFDFRNDPYPSEVLKVDLPLRRLFVRISHLFHVFPGNSILIIVGQVVERMRRLDLNKVSLEKMIAGLEVILCKAQEWEQHAS